MEQMTLLQTQSYVAHL